MSAELPLRKRIGSASIRSSIIRLINREMERDLPHKIGLFGGSPCPKQFWLLVNVPQPEPDSAVNFDRIMVERAWLLFPGHVLVEDATCQHREEMRVGRSDHFGGMLNLLWHPFAVGQTVEVMASDVAFLMISEGIPNDR